MPNWATCTLAFTGSKESVDLVRSSLISIKSPYGPGDDLVFDFDRLVPVPTALKGIAHGTTMVETEEEADRINADNPNPALYPPIRALSREHVRHLQETYGASNEYNWVVRNWGTKFSPDGVTVLMDEPETLVLRFDTAWTEPDVYLSTISREHGLAIFGGVIYEDGDEFAALSYGLDDDQAEILMFESLFVLRQERMMLDEHTPYDRRWVELLVSDEQTYVAPQRDSEIVEEPGGFETMPEITG